MKSTTFFWQFAALITLTTGVALSSGAQQPGRWSLEPTPALTLGQDDVAGNALLQVVVFATRLPDGSIMVGDRGEYALKQFDKSGKFVRALGRKGSGPGEIRYLGHMFRCGDSLYTFDIAEGHRMSVFGLDGRYRRQFLWRTPPGQTVPYVSACNANGAFVHVGWPSPGPPRGGVHREQVPVWMSRGDASAPQMLDSVAGSERWGIVQDGKPVGSRPLPLGKQPVVAMGRTNALVGTADRFQIKAYGLNGRALKPIERTGVPAALTKSDIRDAIEREVADIGEDKRARVEASYASMTFPQVLPAYTQMLVDADDHLWVRPFPRGTGNLVSWSIFTPAGAFVGEVGVPRHLEVFEIGRDYVLGRYMDPKEAIPEVRLYRLKRS